MSELEQILDEFADEIRNLTLDDDLDTPARLAEYERLKQTYLEAIKETN